MRNTREHVGYMIQMKLSRVWWVYYWKGHALSKFTCTHPDHALLILDTHSGGNNNVELGPFGVLRIYQEIEASAPDYGSGTYRQFREEVFGGLTTSAK